MPEPTPDDSPPWFATTAVDLLIEAGADQRLIDRHVDDDASGSLDSCEQSHDLGRSV